MIQTLEPRLFLSGVTTNLTAGLLTVRGSAHSDNIDIAVLDNGVTVKDRGVVIFSTPIFSTDVFAGIVVDARGGNDIVTMNVNETPFRTEIHGGKGNDNLEILSFHGQGGIVYGGCGDDTIHTDTEITGSSIGAKIFGGSGRDTITATNGGGGAGSSVDGGSGNDRITINNPGNDFTGGGSTVHGAGGNDVIHGGNLADQLFGDAGKDHLFGGKGDDTMDGGAGKDALDGEDGNDTAVNSGQDTFTNVENLI
ncbi:MAG TPA: hypothetical protein VH518_06620 [Tepidisphaeraceae bacterium]